ncbi:hypothetical protein TIFTF001_054577 [Ficus carica]|uniref:Uncharacterized protein n=1 Tax=Ficus carica TaxID=3494 RepID=A0AA88JEI3_FICCA|nr:hypothetical protein TIFTF001_054577 [Ficus carica]
MGLFRGGCANVEGECPWPPSVGPTEALENGSDKALDLWYDQEWLVKSEIYGAQEWLHISGAPRSVESSDLERVSSLGCE